MDIKFIESLIAVIDGGSIAEAARQQRLTAAAIGQRVRALENQLGTKLIIRSGSTVCATNACKRVLPRLRMVLAEVALLPSDLAADGLAGSYRLGAISTALIDHASRIVKGLVSAAPEVQITIVPGTSIQLFEMVSSGELDAAIVVLPPFTLGKNLRSTTLEEQPLVRVLPSRPISDSLPLIVYDRSSWGGMIGWQWIKTNISNKHVLCEIDSPETVVSLVGSSIGYSVLPLWNDLLKTPNICINHLENSPIRRIVFLRSNINKMSINDLCLEILNSETLD